MDETAYLAAGLVTREAGPAAARTLQIVAPNAGDDFFSHLVVSTLMETPTEMGDEETYSGAERKGLADRARTPGPLGHKERQRDHFGFSTQPDWAAQALALHLVGSEGAPPRSGSAAASPEPQGDTVSDEPNTVPRPLETAPLPLTHAATPAWGPDRPPPQSLDITLPVRSLLDADRARPIALLPAALPLTGRLEASDEAALSSRSETMASRESAMPADLPAETRAMDPRPVMLVPGHEVADQPTVRAVSARPSTRSLAYDPAPPNETAAGAAIAVREVSGHQRIAEHDETPSRIARPPEEVSSTTPAATGHHVGVPPVPAEVQWVSGGASQVPVDRPDVTLHAPVAPDNRDTASTHHKRTAEITRHDVVALLAEPLDARIRVQSATSQAPTGAALSIAPIETDGRPLVTRSATGPAPSVDRTPAASRGSNQHEGPIGPALGAADFLLMPGGADAQQPATSFIRPNAGGNHGQGQEQQMEAGTVSLPPPAADVFAPPPATPATGESGPPQETEPADRILATAPSRISQQPFAQDPIFSPLRQLTEAAASLRDRASGSHRLEIALHPASLGKLQVQIIRSEDMPARVEITVTRSETLMALRHDMPALHQALDAAGIPSANREVSIQLALPASGASVVSDTGPQFTRDEGGHHRQRYHTADPKMSDQPWNSLPDPDPVGPVSVRSTGRHGIDITA